MKALYEKIVNENLSKVELRKLKGEIKKKSEVLDLAEKPLDLLQKKVQLPENERKGLAVILKEVDKLSVYWYG